MAACADGGGCNSMRGGHPNIAKGFEKAKRQEDDHLLKIKTLLRRDLINQIS